MEVEKLLEAAKNWIEIGARVLPVWAEDKDERKKAKNPYYTTVFSHGAKTATADLQALAVCLLEARRAGIELGIGVVLPADYCWIDIDRAAPAHPDGLDTLQRIYNATTLGNAERIEDVNLHTAFGDTYIERSPSGGYHILIKQPVPPLKQISEVDGKGIGIRAAANYYCVVAPTVFKDGRKYDVVSGLGQAVPDLSSYLTEPLRNLKAYAAKLYNPAPAPISDPACLAAIERSLTSSDSLFPPVQQGGRNNAMIATAGKFIAKGLGRSDVNEICRLYNDRFIPPLSDREIAGCIERAWKKDLENHPERHASDIDDAAEARRAAVYGARADARLIGLERTIEESKTEPYYPTGFVELDKILDGGFTGGSLSVLGAISSLGKTTFALALAQNIAASGKDVLIFSLEMSSDELLSKMLSSLSYQIDKDGALSMREIIVGKKYQYHRLPQVQALKKAKQEFSGIASRIYIIEGNANIGIAEIEKAVRRHIEVTGNRPLVIIDYFQILKTHDVHYTDKQSVDYNVTAVKSLAREARIPVLAISSFNRDNYMEPLNMTAFKESGAIEYSSDILIGLQYKGFDYVTGESQNARRARLSDLKDDIDKSAANGGFVPVQLKVLKNRTGFKASTDLYFKPRYNYFTDIEPADTVKIPTPAEQKERELREQYSVILAVLKSGGMTAKDLATKLKGTSIKQTTLKNRLEELENDKKIAVSKNGRTNIYSLAVE